MSYYHEDTSHYCYTVPAHYVDAPSYDNYTPSAPTPTYYVETSYDTPADPIHYVDTSPYDELEAYAEYASNRIYTEDEIHPAYLVHLADPPSDPIYYNDTPPNLIFHADIIPDDELEAYAEAASNKIYTEDEIHPAYRNHVSNDNHEDPPIPEHHWKEYTWKVLKFDGGRIIKYDPPTDPTFYIPSSHDNAPDWDLVQSIELIGSVLEDYREFFMRAADDDDIEECTSRVNQLTLVSQHMEEILARRKTDANDDRKDDEDDVSNPQPQSTPSPHHTLDNDVTSTPPPDILIPDPLPLSPNIWYEPAHHTPAFLIATTKHCKSRYHFGSPVRHRRQPKFRPYKFRINTRTNPPPDIRPPEPYPPSPNILIQSHRHKLHLLNNRHPPDIRAPKPFPPSPNIPVQPPPHQQPRRPAYTRPRRKHPPTPTPKNRHHNAKRRISKKSHPHSV
jgi:hypothetical protein